MTRRSTILVILLTFLTFGLYGLYWKVSTKNEMNRQGAQIPTALLMVIPIVSIYWTWKYSEGVEQVSERQMSGVVAFLLLFFLGVIGIAILQSQYNKIPERDGLLPEVFA